jgi:hypothetical protein
MLQKASIGVAGGFEWWCEKLRWVGIHVWVCVHVIIISKRLAVSIARKRQPEHCSSWPQENYRVSLLLARRNLLVYVLN